MKTQLYGIGHDRQKLTEAIEWYSDQLIRHSEELQRTESQARLLDIAERIRTDAELVSSLVAVLNKS